MSKAKDELASQLADQYSVTDSAFFNSPKVPAKKSKPTKNERGAGRKKGAIDLKRTTLFIGVEQAKALKKIAAEENKKKDTNVTLSVLIREAIDMYIKKKG